MGAGKVLQDVTNLKVDDDTEDEIQSVASKITTGSARRRSSFGLSCRSSPFNPVEQLRITEMYKTVIQMSAENVRPSYNGMAFPFAYKTEFFRPTEAEREKLLEL